MMGLERLGDCDIFVKRLHIKEADNFKINNDVKGIKGISKLDLDYVGYIKDLSFLKVRKIPNITLSNLKIDSLFGLQYGYDTKLKFFSDVGDDKNNFEYHRLFYEKNKMVGFNDYWNEIVDYWLNQVATEEKSGFDVMFDEGDLKEVIFDGIKLPEEEIDRLFTPDQAKILRSLYTVKKYNL
jgi:hypothetical protein